MFRDFLAGRAPIKPVYKKDSGFLGFIGLRSVKTHAIVIWMLLAPNIMLSLMDNKYHSNGSCKLDVTTKRSGKDPWFSMSSMAFGPCSLGEICNIGAQGLRTGC